MHTCLALLLVAAGFSACSITEDATDDVPADIVTVGQQLPAFSVVTTDGRTVTSDSLLGRPAVICFFTTTCSDCRKALPVVQQLYEEWGEATGEQSATAGEQSATIGEQSAMTGEQSAVVSFLCIGREQAADAVSDYWASQGLTLPVSPQSDRAVYSLFARRSVPRVYVVDAAGVVRNTYVESVSYKEVDGVLKGLSSEASAALGVPALLLESKQSKVSKHSKPSTVSTFSKISIFSTLH